MTDLIVIRKSKLSQSPNQKDDIYQEINEKPGFRVFFFFLNPQGQSCTSGRDRELGCYYVSWGFFPGGSTIKNRLPIWETWVQSLSQEDPLEKEMPPTPVVLPGNFRGQRSLVG